MPSKANTTATPIAVLGAGSWGTALALLLARNGHAVHLWGYDANQVSLMQEEGCNSRYLPGIPFPDNLELFADLGLALSQVQDILVVVPSHAFTELLLRIQPYVTAENRLAWGTKGLDRVSGELLHLTVARLLGKSVPKAVLAGPSFALEVALQKPTAITLGSTDPAWAQALSDRLINLNFRVYTTEDMAGVEVCGAVKNILAIAAGIVDGLDLGMNALSALITRGLAEMQRLGIAVGGSPNTFMGLAGVGDLILTCTGHLSRNRRFGSAIAKGKTSEQARQEIGQAVEGLSNLQGVYQLAQRLGVEMPITEQIYQVIYQQVPVGQGIRNLLSREPKTETDF